MDFWEIIALIFIPLAVASVPIYLNERSKRIWSQADKMWDLKQQYSSELLLKMSEMELALMGIHHIYSPFNRLKKPESIAEEYNLTIMDWSVINLRLFDGKVILECLKNGAPGTIEKKDLEALKSEIYVLSLLRFQMLTHEALVPISKIRGILIDDKITDIYYKYQNKIKEYINQGSHTTTDYEGLISELGECVKQYNEAMKLELEKTRNP